MLIVKFRETFQTRYAEWATATGMALFGFLLIGNQRAFDQPFYATLKSIFGTADTLGWLAFLFGVARLIVLFINGAWKRTPLLRMIGCICGVMLFSFLLVSTLTLEWVTPTVSFWAVLMMLELTSMKFATNDNTIASRALGAADGRGG